MLGAPWRQEGGPPAKLKKNHIGHIKVKTGNDQVVGYRLELGTSSQCLLLTGPNAGGKTVVLKTMGLLALLVWGSFLWKPIFSMIFL